MKNRMVCSIVGLLLCCFMHADTTNAQDDFLDMLRRFPSDRDFMTTNSVEAGLLMLQWQKDRGDVHTELLKNRADMLEARIEDLGHQEIRLSHESPIMGLTSASNETRELLLSRVLERLMDIRVDIAGHEALVKQLMRELEESESTESARASKKALEEATKEVAKLRDELSESNARSQEGNSARGDGANLYGRYRSAKLIAEKAQADENVRRDRLYEQILGPLTETQRELLRLKAQEKMSVEQLEQLAKAGGVMRDLKSVRRKIDQLNEQVDLIQKDQNEIALQESELEALRHQVERAMKSKGNPSKTGNSKKDNKK